MESPVPAQPDAYAAWHIPAFRRYMLGAQLMTIGVAAQGLAVGWEMYSRTDQPLALGLVGLVMAVPMLLFTLPAGYLADVFDRRLLMILSMLGTSITSLALAVFSHMQGPIEWMYVLLFLDATAICLGGPARSAMLPQLVPREMLENAIKWGSSLGQVSRLVGPAAGGFLISWSLPAAYLVSAGSTLVFMVLLMTITLPPRPVTPRGQPVRQVLEGIGFVWRRKLLLSAISLDLFAVVLGGATYLLPIYARDIIDLTGWGLTPEQALGWLQAAPAAGGMLMAITLAHLPPVRRAGLTMLLGVMGFGIVSIVFGISTSFPLSMAMLLLTGVFDSLSVIIRHTLVQLITPDHMRGRVSAVNSLFIGSSNEIGGFESGLVAQLTTPLISVVSGGIGTLLIVLTWGGLFPQLRTLGRLTDLPASQ